MSDQGSFGGPPQGAEPAPWWLSEWSRESEPEVTAPVPSTPPAVRDNPTLGLPPATGWGPPPSGWGAPVGPGDEPPRRRTGGGRVALAAVVLLLALAAGAVGAAIGVHVGRPAATTDAASTQSAQTAPVIVKGGPGSQADIEAVAKAISPSVVLIAESAPRAGLSATGSGIILRPDGYILTNNHVVSAAAQTGGTITVTFTNGRTVPATVVGRDPSSDLAVVKVSNVSGLTAARLGNSNTDVVGETVLAVGAPLGLQSTVTEGIISAVNRPVFTGDEPSVTDTNAVIDAIQTDAAINPGNSGGPLVNANGDVIGINSAIATLGSSVLGSGSQSGNIGIGFAIPINSARQVADQLVATGHAIHAQLGIRGEDAPNNGGALVRSVLPGSGAAKAGVQPGDVITAVDGSPVPNFDTLVVDVRNHNPGQVVTVTFRRDGQTHTVSVTLGRVVD